MSLDLQGLTCQELVSLPPEQRSTAQVAVAVAAKVSMQADIDEQNAMLKMAKVGTCPNSVSSIATLHFLSGLNLALPEGP